MSKLYRAIFSSVIGKLGVYLIQFLFMAVYARIFTPDTFGILASIQVFVIFFQMLSDVGIGPAIINEHRFSAEQRNGVYSFTLVLGLFLSGVFYLFSYFLNYWYGSFEYQNIAAIIMVSVFFNSISIIPITALNKDAKFMLIACFDFFSELLSFIVVFVLYKKGFGIYALASKAVTQSIFRYIFAMFYSLNTSLGRPSFSKDFFYIKDISHFAIYQFLFNFINYFSRNLDNILVGKYLGMVPLGIYDKSYQLMRYPLVITTYAMTPAIQPVLTKIRNDSNKIRLEHNKLFYRVLYLSVLMGAFVFFNAKAIVLTVFGGQWESVIPLVEIFSLIIPVQSVLSLTGAFFQVMNRPKLLLISGVISAVTTVTAIIGGVYIGNLLSISYFLVIAFFVNLIQSYFLLFFYCFRCGFCDFLIGSFKVLMLSCFSVSIYQGLCSFFNIWFIGNGYIFDLFYNLFFAILSLLFSLLLFFKIKNIIL